MRHEKKKTKGSFVSKKTNEGFIEDFPYDIKEISFEVNNSTAKGHCLKAMSLEMRALGSEFQPVSVRGYISQFARF